MLPRNWQQQGQSPNAEPTRAQPGLSARLRLFALLTLIGPLFGGLQAIVLEAAPPVEPQVLVSDAVSPTPDVVVVETVVERVVYVPIDNVVGAGSSSSPQQVRPSRPDSARPVAGGGPADDVAKDTTQAQQEAAQAETAVAEQVAASAASASAPVSPPVWVAPSYRVAPKELVADEAEELAEDAEPAEDAGEQVATAPVDEITAPEDEAPVAEEPRIVVVHTLTWDGEQFTAVPGGPVEQYVVEGTREEVAAAPAGAPATESEAATAPRPDGVAPGDGEPSSVQVASDDEATVAESAEGDGESIAPEDEVGDDGEPPANLADTESQEAEELIVKADKAEAAERQAAESETADEMASHPLAEFEPAVDDDQAVADDAGSDPIVEAIQGAAADGAAAIDVAAEVEIHEAAEAPEPQATPTVGRQTAGESVEIVLPSN